MGVTGALQRHAVGATFHCADWRRTEGLRMAMKPVIAYAIHEYGYTLEFRPDNGNSVSVVLSA